MHASPVRHVRVRCWVQVPLMAALRTAQAAMDAHRGVAAVAEQGLCFLRKLSVMVPNRVSLWACFGQPWCTHPYVVVRTHAQCARRSCGAECRCR